ncbi:MAG: pantothenate kinase [Thermoproteus sp.]
MVLVEVPLHVTSIWSPRYTDDPLTTGSIGCGVLLRPGVRMYVGRGGGRPGVKHIELALEGLGVDAGAVYKSPVDLGVGYGLSAALTLGAALGAAALAGRPMLEGARLAHAIEVRLGTGLGDVAAEYYGGGIEMRVRPGAPGVGLVDRIPHPRDLVAVAVDLGRYPTDRMLAELRDRLAAAGDRYMEELMREPTYERFASLSREFSREVGFLGGDLEGRIGACARYADTYYAKKRVLLFLTYRDEAEALAECLRGVGLAPRGFALSEAGAKIFTDRRR